jgi:hypothetical protein
MINPLTQQYEENDKLQWEVGGVRNIDYIILILKPLWEDMDTKKEAA